MTADRGLVTRANRAALAAFGRETSGGSWVTFMSRVFPGIDENELRVLLDAGETSVLTDPTGTYSFASLQPGN